MAIEVMLQYELFGVLRGEEALPLITIQNVLRTSGKCNIFYSNNYILLF